MNEDHDSIAQQNTELSCAGLSLAEFYYRKTSCRLPTDENYLASVTPPRRKQIWYNDIVSKLPIDEDVYIDYDYDEDSDCGEAAMDCDGASSEQMTPAQHSDCMDVQTNQMLSITQASEVMRTNPVPSIIDETRPFTSSLELPKDINERFVDVLAQCDPPACEIEYLDTFFELNNNFVEHSATWSEFKRRLALKKCGSKVRVIESLGSEVDNGVERPVSSRLRKATRWQKFSELQVGEMKSDFLKGSAVTTVKYAGRRVIIGQRLQDRQNFVGIEVGNLKMLFHREIEEPEAIARPLLKHLETVMAFKRKPEKRGHDEGKRE